MTGDIVSILSRNFLKDHAQSGSEKGKTISMVNRQLSDYTTYNLPEYEARESTRVELYGVTTHRLRTSKRENCQLRILRLWGLYRTFCEQVRSQSHSHQTRSRTFCWGETVERVSVLSCKHPTTFTYSLPGQKDERLTWNLRITYRTIYRMV